MSRAKAEKRQSLRSAEVSDSAPPQIEPDAQPWQARARFSTPEYGQTLREQLIETGLLVPAERKRFEGTTLALDAEGRQEAARVLAARTAAEV